MHTRTNSDDGGGIAIINNQQEIALHFVIRTITYYLCRSCVYDGEREEAKKEYERRMQRIRYCKIIYLYKCCVTM